jgi:predicted methyltransferase
MNLITKTTELAMTITLQYVKEGDFVIDATCGNGNDTLVLSRAVGQSGRVLAVDIQQQAIDNTEKLLTDNGLSNTRCVMDSFENLGHIASVHFAGERPSAVVFNLGYLPGGDKTVTTVSGASLNAVKQALELIKTGGIVTVVLYDGHEAGRDEKCAILEMAGELPSRDYHVVYTNMLNQKKSPPEVLWITRKR